MTDVQLPDGRTARFPDDMPREEIERVLQEQFPAAPKQKPRIDTITEAAAQAGRNLASGGGPTGPLKATALGISSGFFGVGDRLARENLKKLIPNATEEELTEGSRAFMRAAFETDPAAYGAGFVFGGGGAGKLALRGAQAIPGAAGIVGAARGQPIRNLLRQAAGGAAGVTATTGVGEERLPTPTEATIGAVAGPVAGQAARAAALTKRFLERTFAPSAAAARKMAEITGKSAEDIFERAKAFKKDTGRDPTLGNLLTPSERADIGDVTRLSPRTRDIFERGLVRAQQAMQENLARVVRSTGRAASEAEILALRNRAFKSAIRPIEKQTVRLNASDLQALSSAGAFNRKVPTEVVRAVRAGNPTVEEMDALRQNLLKIEQAIKKNPAKRAELTNAKNLTESTIAAHFPEYGEAVRDFAKTSDAARGARVAQSGTKTTPGIRGAGTPEEFASALPDTPEGRLGLREGARADLLGQIGESPATALNLARRASQGNLRDKIAIALGEGKGGRISRAAGAEARGVESVQELAGRGAISAEGEQAQLLADAILATTAANRGVGGAAVSGFFTRRLGRLKMPDRVRDRIAEMAADPERAPDAIRALKRAGVSNQEILDMYQEAAIAAGSSLGRGDVGQ